MGHTHTCWVSHLFHRHLWQGLIRPWKKKNPAHLPAESVSVREQLSFARHVFGLLPCFQCPAETLSHSSISFLFFLCWLMFSFYIILLVSSRPLTNFLNSHFQLSRDTPVYRCHLWIYYMDLVVYFHGFRKDFQGDSRIPSLQSSNPENREVTKVGWFQGQDSIPRNKKGNSDPFSQLTEYINP